MARARNIKPGFFKNPELAEVGYETRLLFIGLWMLADRDGYLEDRPKRIKMELFPADNIDIENSLSDLEKHGFIQRYTVDGNRFLWVCKFSEHQHPHRLERPSIIPKPGASPGLGITQQPEKPGANLGLYVVHKPENPGLAPVKTQANPADSLNPDSLNPDSKTKPKKPVGFLLVEFLENCKAKGEPAFSDYKPLWDYADRVGIPKGWVALCWRMYRRKHEPTKKRQLDWRQAFRNNVEGNWLKLWYFDAAGQCLMTSTGHAELKHSDSEPVAA